MKAEELIEFLLWAEQIHRPRLLRLCECAPYVDEYNPILQTMGYDGKLLGNDSPGQAGIRVIIEEFNDWKERLKVGKARELTAVVVAEDDNTGQ